MGLSLCEPLPSRKHGFALYGADSPECAHLDPAGVWCDGLGEVKGLSVFYFYFFAFVLANLAPSESYS